MTARQLQEFVERTNIGEAAFVAHLLPSMPASASHRHLAEVAVAARRWAQLNPEAFARERSRTASLR